MGKTKTAFVTDTGNTTDVSGKEAYEAKRLKKEAKQKALADKAKAQVSGLGLKAEKE
jgi:hypothetical protein